MNISRRLRHERRSATRREKRQLYDLYLLQSILMWLQQKELGITDEQLGEVAMLQKLLLWTQEDTGTIVYVLSVRLYRHRSHMTGHELEHTRPSPAARKRKRPKLRMMPKAVRDRLERRALYRGGRKARGAVRRLAFEKPWSYAAMIGGAGLLMYSALGLWRRRGHAVGMV